MITFKPNKLHYSNSSLNEKEFVPNEFSLMSWNIYKKNHLPHFERYIRKQNYDFYLFQEALITKNILKGLSFQSSANIEIRGKNFGVVIASKYKPISSKAFITEGKEFFFGTHKSFIINKYKFEDNSALVIINLHSINFRGNISFSKEIDIAFEKIKNYKESIIIAGDFNTWNRNRLNNLEEKIEQLNLKKVPFKEKTKSFFNNELDFIFYRGLDLISSDIDKNHNISDHHPLFVKFKKNYIISISKSISF